jgi:leucyl aminopeptidase (aminopeptidase T)
LRFRSRPSTRKYSTVFARNVLIQRDDLVQSDAELRKIYEDGLNVDYSQLQATAATMKGILSAGKRVHFTAPGGTDLTLDIAGQSTRTSDGIITPEKRKAGGIACQTWLPAGEVYFRTVPDSAEGKVLFDHFYNELLDWRTA